MADPKQTLTASEISAAALADWRQDGGTLTARFATADFATGLELVNRIGASAEEANHHPDLTLTYPQVTGDPLEPRRRRHNTSRDIDLARTISDHAATLRVSAEQGAEQG